MPRHLLVTDGSAMRGQAGPRKAARLVSGVLAAALAVALAPTVAPTTARAADGVEAYAVPASGTLALSGLGYGHGIGMSQFGAEGMGRQGKGYREILDFYYPGTTLTTVDPGATIRVSLSGMTSDGGSTVSVEAKPALRATADGSDLALPATVAGKDVTGFRVVRGPSGVSVWADAGASSDRLASGVSGEVVFDSSAEVGRSRVTLESGGGSARTYHGRVVVDRTSSGLLVMDALLVEHYLRAVVSLEVPGSWTPAALRAQAVAARSYALLVRKNARAAGQRYDICDTTACQAFGSLATESANEVDAVTATAGEYLESGGEPVFAQFSSANGGYSVAGSRPYLVAQPDPYDGVVTGAENWGHAWQRTITATAIEATWPSIGTLKTLKVLGRDGHGDWGGRVLSVGLVGSGGTVTMSGDSFRIALGLKSTWWVVTNAATTADSPAPRQVRGTPLDRSLRVSWERPTTKRRITGYVVTVQPGATTRELGPTRRKVTVRGLVNGVEYRAKVAAVYATGRGDRSRSRPVVPTSTESYFRSVGASRLLLDHDVASLDQSGGSVLQVTGVGGVPRSEVRAVVLRVSAGGAKRGSAVAWRGGSGTRLTAATFAGGQRATGLVTVPVSSSGTVSVGTTVPARFLRVDLVGYYTESGVASWSFHGMPTTALADSTKGLGLPKERLRDGDPVWVKVAGHAGVPRTGATAVLVNVTLLRSTASAQLSLASPRDPFATGLAVRTVAGARRTASAVGLLDSRGRLALRLAGARAHVKIDVLGWFAPHDGSAAGRFTFSQARLLDARTDGPMGDGESAVLAVAGVGAVPASARAVVLLVRAFGAQTTGSVRLRAHGATDPARVSVAFDDLGPTRNLVTLPVGADGAVEALCAGDAADVTVQVVGWYS